MAMAQGGPVAIAYAARHPERVTRLLFYGSYAVGAYGLTAEELELTDTFEQLIKVGWARPDSTFRRVFTSLMIPGATEEQMRWLDDLQRVAVSASTAVLARASGVAGGRRRPAAALDVPTLVLHSVGDRMNDFDVRPAAGLEHPRRAAGRRWTATTTSCWRTSRRGRCSSTRCGGFLRPTGSGAVPARVVEDAARPRVSWRCSGWPPPGCDNDEIAAELQLSVRTVERHLQNVYVKLGVQRPVGARRRGGPAARARLTATR